MGYRGCMATLTSALLGLARPKRREAASADLAATLARSQRERHRAAQDRFEADATRLADAAAEAMLRSVGHELRSPLAAIMMAASTLKHSDLDLEPEEREDLTATIVMEVARLEWLLSNPGELLGSERGAVG